MSKDTKGQPKFSLEGLGFSGLDSSPVVQQVKQKAATERADTLFPYDATDKIGIISGDQAASEYQSALDKGYQLYGDTKKVDQTLGEAQSTGEQFGTAIARFAPMTALKLVESISSLGAGVKYLATGETDWMDPSAGWNQYLKQVDEQIRTALPIHATKEYDEGTIGDQLLSSKFWTDDASDGLQFLVAQIIGSKGLGAAVNLAGKGIGAAAELANLSALYKAVPVTQRIATAVANNFNTGTVGFLNTISNAALQAKDTGLQIEAALRNRYGSEVNPDTGDYYTGEEIDNKIAKDRYTIDGKIKNTFWATAAVGLLPELYEAKLILGAGKAHMGQYSSDIMKAVNAGKVSLADLEKGVGLDVLRKTGWKGILKEGTKAGLAEGVWEENMENAIQKYDIDQATSGQHDDVWDSKMGYLAQFLDNFTDKEGLKAIILGSLMGGLMGGARGYSDTAGYNEGLSKHLNSLQAADNLFAPAIQSIYKTDKDGNIQIDADGNPVEDTENLSKLMFQMLADKNNWDNQTAAVLSGNRVAATINENLALGQSIARELQSDRYSTVDEAREYFKWFHGQRIKEQGMEAAKEATDDEVVENAEAQSQNPDDAAANGTKVRSAMKTGSAQGDANLSVKVSNNSKLVDSMFEMWETSGKQADRLTKLGQDSSRTAFNDNVRRALYYESIKRESLRDIIKEKEAELREVGADREAINKQIVSINATIADSELRTSDFLNKPDELYKRWAAANANHKTLLESSIAAAERYDKEKTDVNSRVAQTADYMLQEHVAKEGATDSGIAETDTFLTNQPIADRTRVPISMRNETYWKAGNDYLKLSRLRTMMDKVRSGELPLHEAVNYATDSITRLDDATRKELQQLITDEKVKIAADEQLLATMPDFDEETMEFNPEYQELEQKIEKNKEAVASSINVLEKAAKADELNMLNQRPDRIEETLNKRFAEEQLQRGENVLSNSTEDGIVKDSYTDARSVNNVIAQVTKMRNALEDRTTSGDLKGQTQYNYLIAKADKMLSELQKVANAVVDNKLKRDGIQASIAQRQASSNALALGFDLDTNSIVNEPVFNMTNQILKGKLKDMLAQVKSMDSGNFYEGTMSILHAVKTAASVEDMSTLRDLMEEQIDSLIATVPDPKVGKHWKTGLAKSPELYVAGLIQSLYTDNGSALDKGQPLATYNSNNDIDELESRFSAMPDDADGLDATSRSNILTAVKAAKQIIAIDRVKNLLNSSVDLHKNVTEEIKLATDGNGVVPTAQQEIAIRDGLAWLSSNSSVNGEKFSGWAFLRGIAGTGKTSVTVKWILNLSGLKNNEILATAATDRAAKVLGDATNTETTTMDALMEGTISSDKKLIVIDEYARISRERLDEFEQKVREHNKNQSPADRVRVLILGDPTQITPLTFSNQDITQPGSNRSAGNIRVINPLTIVYRSEVSAVNEASDIFQANSKPVESINVRADKPMGAALSTGVHTSKAAQDIFDIVRTNMKTEQDNGLTPRTRVVIASDTAKYASLGIPVISVYDAQSETYQEVYVDLDPNDFNSTEKFNTAMYTAASRAKEYTYLRYDNGVNTVDPGLSREKENNDQVGREAKGDYIKARSEEKLMMEKAVKGESINVPKTEATKAAAQSETPLEKEADPAIAEDDIEIVTEVASSPADQTLPPDIDPVGFVDPESEEETPVEILDSGVLQPEEKLLPNIEKGTFEALGGRRNIQAIGKGSKVAYMYTKEPNGENAVTVFAFDPDGNWIPISKVFQEELQKFPQYVNWKNKVAGMNPMFSSDPQQLNAIGGKAAYTLSDMAIHLVDEGEISRHQRLTYVFGNESVQDNVAQRIKDVFKSKFFSSRAAEQAKADKIVFRIFRNNELQSHKFGGFKPEAGIPYAVVNADANSRDWSRAQFVRLTANRLSQESEHYRALKQYRDLAKELENATGITPGSTDFSRVVKALKNSLEIVKEETIAGTEPKVRLREDYTRKEFVENLQKVTDKTVEFTDPTENLTQAEFEQLLPKMQNLTSMLYGLHEVRAEMTQAEMEKAHGTDYDFLPIKGATPKKVTAEDGSITEEPVGRVRLKGTGPDTGKRDIYVTDWELNAKKGKAQVALNQLAKANEFVGNVRIRTDIIETNKKKVTRAAGYTGKSLMTDKGGDAAAYNARKVLIKILGEDQVAQGKLEEADLTRKETRDNLDKQVRKLAQDFEGSAQELGAKILAESSLDEDRRVRLETELYEALNKKETLPITMATLDLLVGDENYEAGQHLTAAAYNVTNPKSGKTKETRTYLRTPLDIDQFNELGKSPEANSEELSKFVGTKFQDILPTQIAVINKGDVAASKPIMSQTIQSIAPAATRDIQNRIDEIATQVATMSPGKERRALLKEQAELIAKRDDTAMLFNEPVRADKGSKITVSEAKAEIKRMLPNISDNEIYFLNKSLMIELQRPGESLLGLFQKGKLFFLEDEGRVYDNVVRHEIFHKVFNDYLTARDRTMVANEFDPQGQMAPTELEEALADRFMLWQKAPETATGKLKRLFNRILQWIGLARSNGSVIDQLFNDIHAGKFQKQDGESPNTRMAFSDIRKWGTVQDYKEASRFLQLKIFENFIDENIENPVYTQAELFELLKTDFREKYNEVDSLLNNVADEVGQLAIEYQAADSDAERTELQSEIDAYNTITIEANQTWKILHTFTSDEKALRDMWKDLYPNFSFKKSGVVKLEEDPIHDDPESLEKTEDEESKDAASIRSDFVLNSDEKNQETKISQNVKNFLSFIYRPKITGKNARHQNRINPRGVYLLALRNLSGLQTGDSNFIQQLSQRAKENGVNLNSNSDAALVINHIINLHRNATDNAYEFNTGRDTQGNAKRYRVELPGTHRFLDENTFVVSLDGSDISGITQPDANHLVIERGNRSTSAFLEEVLSSNITAEQAKGYFKQMQAQETLREIMSNFTSQREAIPMIAEEVNDMGSIQLRYFRAQMHGSERIQTTEIENSFKANWDKATLAGWKDFEKAKPQDQNRAIADLLKHLGIDGEDIRNSESGLVAAVYGDLKAFRKVVQDTATQQVMDFAAEASDSDESAELPNPVVTALEKNSGMLDRLTKLLTRNSSDERASSYTDVKGTKRYLFHNGSQAHDTIGKIIRHFGDKIGSLPAHLTEDAVLSKNIFITGINRIHELLDHDGTRQEGREEFATDYSSETNKQWLERNFSYGFLSFLKTNARDNADALTYDQQFYTTSNRPRILGARVEVLSEQKIGEALVQAIEQHVTQPDLVDVKNYDRFKVVNFDEFHVALGEVDTKTTEGRVKLAELYDEIANSDQKKAEIAQHIIGQLKVQARTTMERMKSEKVKLSSDAYEAIRLLKDKRRQVLSDESVTPEARVTTWPEDEQMLPTVESFYMNNYVNSFFLNQAVAGNMNFFKDALDMVKRMSGVFAPGTKGIVGDRFFMKEKFRVVISADPKMKAEYLSPIFKDTKLMEAVKQKSFDLADAQGFMLPERATNIIQGFGRNYNAGAVFKPAHYEVAKRGDTYVPVMLKYSSVVLSDELVNKHPKLAALREEMRKNKVDEFVFDSGTKVGAPSEQTKLPSPVAYENNNISIAPESIVTLSNENYRLQLNPSKEAFEKVSNPTQLGYFLNVMHNLTKGGQRNLTNAKAVYEAIGEKIQRGVAKLGKTVLDTDGKVKSSVIEASLNGVGNERLQEMLAAGLSYNMPNITDKALIQIANITDKETVKIKFPGGKMVLQSSYGIEFEGRRLEYQQDEKKRWYAEVILPKTYMDKANPGDFLLPDGMGFRIPSTELHSSVPFKVVGFYDSKGSNVVIAPAELVAQHGSDFDVDSLSVIVREQASSDIETANHEFKKGVPVGYYPVNNSLVFNPVRFRNELDEARLDAVNDPKILTQLEKLHDQLLTNQITEAFLDTISHEDNKERMLTPISTDVIDVSFKALGIKAGQKVNLSRLLDNLSVYNSNFQGASLVGVFANGMKSLSYISRAGKDGSYPTLDEKLAFEWNGKKYDSFTEVDNSGGNLWEELDALVNTSVDNVKEQKLFLMNATDKTGPAYVAAKAIGMPLTETMRMMLQPVVKLFSETQGGKSTAISNLKKAIVQHAVGLDIIADGQNYSDLREALKDKLPELTEKNLNARLGSNSLGETTEELAHQVAVLDKFENVHKIGADLSTFSSAIGILQAMPVFYEDISRKIDQWNELGVIVDGKLQTSSDFSFNMDNLLQAQPNIAEAYKAFNFMKETADKSLIKHFPEVKALADQMAGAMKIRLASDDNANRERLKNEIISYLLSSYYSAELFDQKPVTVDRKKGGQSILTGKQAWSHEFAESMENVIKEGKSSNLFLRRLAIKKDSYGLKSIQFSNSSNPDVEESLEMQEGFNAIESQEIKDNLVKYGVLNFGLSFGARNYSMFIPSELLKPMSDFISKDIQKMVKDSSVDPQTGRLISGPLKNIKDNLAIKLAVNNPDKLPYISPKKIAPIQSVDESGKPKSVDMGDKVVPVLSGYNGTYFWHRSYSNPVTENGKLQYTEADFPEFIKQRDGNGRDVVYRRLNDPATDEIIYYQRTGYKNYSGGYDGKLSVIREGYDPSEYFAQGRIPVPVADVRVKDYEARNEFIQEGSSVVVYPFSNATREEGITGIVDKVRKGIGSDKILFTLRQQSNPDRGTEQQHLIDIARTVGERFGLMVDIESKLPAGVKGLYQNGVVYLNPEMMTRDTVFHEVSHPLIAAITKQNPVWYQNLTAELNESTEGRAIMRKVKAKYPELSKEAQETEALVTAVGMEAANRLPESSFRNLVRRLMRSIGNLVRTIMNEIKSTGTISLNTIATEDMAKLTIGDIADILANKSIKLNISGISEGDIPQYSKDLGDEKPEKNSVMEAILAKADTIGEPTRDDSGQEGDSYTYEGTSLVRVSKIMDKFTFRDKTTPNGPDGKPMSTIDAIARRDADRMFRNTAPGGKLIIDGIEQTKQEYETSKKKIQLQARVKGDIIHAKIQRYLAVLNGNAEKVSELDNRIEELSSQADKLPSAYDWVTRKGVFDKLMFNAGINIGSKVAKGQEDKIYAEVKVASPLLGAGKIDKLVEKPDGRLRIVDWKTGSRLKDKYSANILKYGVQENRITDNPLDRAKLQVMIYALMIKAENPTARFDGLVVMHLPNEFEATQARNALSVEVPDYLRMIEQYYRNEEPEVYRKLVEQSPRLFDPREYNAPLNADFAQEVFNSNGMTEAEYYNKLQLDLQKLEVSIAMTKNEDGDGPTKEQRKLRADLLRKIQQGSDYNATNFDGALDPAFEIGLMKRWLGNLEDVHNPYVQNLVSHLRVNEDKAYKEIATNFRQFDKLLESVITEKIGKRTGVKKALTAVDYNKLWANFYTETRTTDPETGTEYVRRGATIEGSENWKRMTKAEQELSVFMRKNMADIYEDVMVSGNLAVVGKKLDGKPMTKQDLYNASRRGANFKYEPDFMPRLVISKEEVNFKLRKQISQGNFSALSDYAKDAWLRFSSDFFDNNAEGYNQKDYGLPVRYLGNANTYGSPESYSMNIEDGYKKYMEQMIRKKHLDSTYMLGQAVKGVLESTNDANGDPAFKQTTGLIDYQLKNILLGESIQKTDKLSRRTGAIRYKDGKAYSVSLLKSYRSMKGGFAAATLWLAPERSFLNAAQATYMVGKETLVNSLPGLKPEERDLSKDTHYGSYKDAMAGMLAAVSGKGNQDFRHQLAKELRLYGDLEEEGGKRNEYLTRGSTLLDSANFGFMYKVPEEITNLQYGFNLLKNLKVQFGKYKGKSMFDMYKDSFNPATGTFELPADFRRGLIEKGDGSFEELKGIHPLEINKIHVGIKKIKGGYRKSEKTAIQGTILGDAFMMFKRWIPALAIQQYQKKFTDPTIGQFELSKIGDELKQKDGEPIYEWRARVVEGRFMTVWNVMMAFAGINKNAGYNWSDLSGEQKKALYDVGVSMITWMGMVGFGAFAFDDKKEDDSLRKLTENLTGRYIEQWWAPNMLSAAMQEPAVLKRTMDVGKAFWQISLAGTEAALGGDKKDIYTQRGDIKGMNQLMKNIPFLNSYYEIDRFYDNYEADSTWDSVSPF